MYSYSCTFHDSNPSAASEISVVSVARKVLSVYMPPIRTGVCPTCFHKALEASSGVPEEQRYAIFFAYIDDLLLLHQDKEKLREFSATVL